MRTIYVALATLALAAPLAAQDQRPANAADPDDRVEGSGQLPAGWEARTDRGQPLDQVKFVAMGNGFHATLGPSAVFYNPQEEKSGNYQVSARFTQTKAPRHPEAYGLIIGGDDLDEPDQKYSYFLVRGTGEYFVATRTGDQRSVVINWTAHDAVQKQDEAGKQVNVLGAEVRGDEVIFTVNGTEVARRPKGVILTEGYWGYRINHNLDVHIDPLTK